MVIDHANYCNLSNPTDPVYLQNDAIGMENNLWGEIIFTSGLGIPTYAMSTVNLEADQAFGDAAELDPFTPVRTFYARYWDRDSRKSSARTAARATPRPTSRSALPGMPASATSVSPSA